MTAEVALLAGILASQSRSVSVILAIVSIGIAIASPAATRRIELTAWWDRDMLDEYERKLLPPGWRLQSPTLLQAQETLVRWAPPSLVLNLAVVAVSCACTAVAVVAFAR
jgi:hypothetical protein